MLALLLSAALATSAQAPAAAPEPALRRKEVRVPVAEGVVGTPLESGLDTIAEHFITPVPREELETRALAALLKSLDPYSQYLEPAEMAAFRSELDATFAGVGINFDYKDASGYPRVMYLLRGGPAAAADVRRRDLLLAVDGADVKGKDWEQVSPLLRGEAGTPVTLKLQREGMAQPLEIRFSRAQIDTPSVRALHRDAAGDADWWLDRERGLGYLRLAAIVAHSAPGVAAVLREMKRGHARGLVLDLRDCSGGLLKGAVDTADLFVDRGRLLTIRQRGEDTVYDAKRGGNTKLPLAILINGGTVSACEMLAGALADNGRGTLVGERSFGKGRMQVIYSLGEGRGGMVMSTGTFHRPNGKTIDKHDVPEGSPEVGIAPQVEVKMTEAQHKAWLEHAELSTGLLLLTPEELRNAPPDPQLEKAVEVLEKNGVRVPIQVRASREHE